MKLRSTTPGFNTSDWGDALKNALQLGVESGKSSIVKTLLEHGASAVHHDSATLPPLVQASMQGNVGAM